MSNNNSTADLQAQIDALQATNSALKAKVTGAVKPITCKVSEKKGCCSVYGLGRFPVSLYRDQWVRLLDKADVIRSFLSDNAASLPTKEDKLAAEIAEATKVVKS